MIAISRTALLVAIAVLASLPATQAQESQHVTLAEPTVNSVASLFKQADTVAIVKIVSGDTENYSIAIYKGEVITTFKGVAAKGTVFFGPYVGERLGWEYVLFLRNVKDPIEPKTASSGSYGTVHYAEVFNEGYSSMMTSYECVFDGKSVEERCDYAVRVCTDYVTLPNSIPTFPRRSDETPFGCRWVRKRTITSLLEKL